MERAREENSTAPIQESAMNQEDGKVVAGVEELRAALTKLRARLGEQPDDVDRRGSGTSAADIDSDLRTAIAERDEARDQMRAFETAHAMSIDRIEELERILHAKDIALAEEVRKGDSMRKRLRGAEQRRVTSTAQLESKQRRLNHLAVALTAAKKERDQAEGELRNRRGEKSFREALAKESAALADVLEERDGIMGERDALVEQLREVRRRSLDRDPCRGLAAKQRLLTDDIFAESESRGVDVAPLRQTQEIMVKGIHVRTSMGSNRMEDLSAWLTGS